MDFYFFIAKDSDVNKKEWDTEDRLKIAFYALVAVLEMLCILFNNIVVLSTNFISAFLASLDSGKVCCQQERVGR